jgi:hypothetical protein
LTNPEAPNKRSALVVVHRLLPGPHQFQGLTGYQNRFALPGKIIQPVLGKSDLTAIPRIEKKQFARQGNMIEWIDLNPTGMEHFAFRIPYVTIHGQCGIDMVGTPFLAWLDSLQGKPSQISADLYYCTRDRSSDPFVTRLESSCANLPGIRLHIHGARQGEVLSAADVAIAGDGTRQSEIWFCGPQGLAEKFKQELRTLGRGKFRFHQEAFEMR